MPAFQAKTTLVSASIHYRQETSDLTLKAGQTIVVAVGYRKGDITAIADQNPTVLLGGTELRFDADHGHTIGDNRLRVFQKRVKFNRTTTVRARWGTWETVSITAAGTTATVTHTGHGKTTGDYVTIQGVTQTDYNGSFQITVVDVDTYTYTMGASPTSPATGSPESRASLTRSLLIVSIVGGIGTVDVSSNSENLSSTNSTSGVAVLTNSPIILQLGYHLSVGQSVVGSSSTGHTAGQNVKTTAGSNDLTLQEWYRINDNVVISAGSFVVGNRYEILTVGTTDFTLIGAANNDIGTIFTATGVGTGTGTAYEYPDMRSRLTSLTSLDHMAVGFAFKPTQIYTGNDAVYNSQDGNPKIKGTLIYVHDESGNPAVNVIIPAELFEDMTQTEIDDFVMVYLQWHAEKTYDAIPNEIDIDQDYLDKVDDQINRKWVV